MQSNSFPLTMAIIRMTEEVFSHKHDKKYIDSIRKANNNKNMKSTTFNQAVKDEVTNLISQNKTVTSYDVTQALRAQVNLHELEFTDRTPEDVDGIETFRVPYPQVRDQVNQLFVDGELPSYKRSFERGPNGSYVAYELEVFPVSATPAPARMQVTGLLNPSTVTSGNTRALPDYKTIILDYVRTHNNVTVKQVQSRMKRTPLKCNEIVNFAQQVGLLVTPQGTVSKAVLTY